MKQIVCFGDSNTYGYIPENGERYPWGVRWTSLLNEKLGYSKYHIEEEGLCGRTTIFEDPLRDNRNGSRMLPALLETHQHADLIIVMLGTNDCKAAYGASAEMIGKGIEKIVGQIRGGAPDSKILLISPIWERKYGNRDMIRSSRRNLSLSQSIWQKFIVRLQKKKILHFLMRLHMQSQVQPIRNIWILRIIDCWQRQFIKK